MLKFSLPGSDTTDLFVKIMYDDNGCGTQRGTKMELYSDPEAQERLNWSIAKCAPCDNFCKRFGRKLAFQRLINFYDRGTRKRLWAQYFTQLPKDLESVQIAHRRAAHVVN